jgi:hypothetical protein
MYALEVERQTCIIQPLRKIPTNRCDKSRTFPTIDRGKINDVLSFQQAQSWIFRF